MINYVDTTNNPFNKKRFSWTDLENKLHRLCAEINEDCALHDSTPKETFVGVYGIPRGGVIIAVMLSHMLDIPYIDRLQSCYGKEFIVVDDIADTGHTLSQMKSEVFDKATFATIHYSKQSTFEPHYWVEEKGDRWIQYPWERDDSEMVQDYKL